jgi:hypothetical protein
MAHDLNSADLTASFTARVVIALVNDMAAKNEVGSALVDRVDTLIEEYFHPARGGSAELQARGNVLRALLRQPSLPEAVMLNGEVDDRE